MTLDDFQYGRALDSALSEKLGEDRRFENPQSDIEADDDQEQTQHERYAPTPGEKLLAGHLAEREHGEVGEKEPARHAELRPGGDESAGMIGARPFHRHQHRAAPFPTDADALDETQDGQKDRAPNADALIGRHQ